MTDGGFVMQPLPPHPDKPDTPRTEVTVLASIDSARFVLPDSVVGVILKVFAPLVYKSVLKVLHRMFHQAAGRAGRMPSTAAAASGPSECGGSSSMLLERLALRPEYAAVDAHAARVLAAQQAAAAAGAGQ
jgi:hypothetical protein